MDEFLAGYPFWAVWLFLYAGATLRGQATYWLGRAAISGAMRADAGPAWWRRTRARLARVEAGAGRGVIQRVGLVAIASTVTAMTSPAATTSAWVSVHSPASGTWISAGPSSAVSETARRAIR